MSPTIIYQVVKFALIAKGATDIDAETRSRAKFIEANVVATAALARADAAGNSPAIVLQQQALAELATWAQAHA